MKNSRHPLLYLSLSMFPANRQDAGQFEQMVRMPGAMFSGRLLKMINMAINDMLKRQGAQSLLSVSQFGSGAFTVLDQMAEIVGWYAQANFKSCETGAGKAPANKLHAPIYFCNYVTFYAS